MRLVPQPLARLIARAARRLSRDRRGNTLMITAFALIPITLSTGMAIDYSQAARLQTKANAAADAASLSGTTKPMLDRSIAAACNTARRTFLAELEQSAGGLTIDRRTNPVVTITETYRSLPSVTLTCLGTDMPELPGFTLAVTRTVTVSYSGASANSFSGVLGARQIEIAGTATARSSTTDFIDIHLALDTSQSMGLAATDADAIKLWNATKALNGRGCQFGCHEKSPSEPYSMEQVARMPSVNARMRIDVLRDATVDMIDTANQTQGSDRKFRFALYRIGKNGGRWGPGTDEYVPLSTDLTTTRGRLASLTLSPNDGSIGYGDTDLSHMLGFIRPKMNATSALIDNGDTQPRARKFLFIVTDGVSDTEQNWCTWGHCTGPIDPTLCTAYKAQGITIGIVYTTYLPVKANPPNPADPSLRIEYTTLVQSFANTIEPNLRACASTNWFFEASDGPSIHAAMQKLFRQAAESTRLTQ